TRPYIENLSTAVELTGLFRTMTSGACWRFLNIPTSDPHARPSLHGCLRCSGQIERFLDREPAASLLRVGDFIGRERGLSPVEIRASGRVLVVQDGDALLPGIHLRGGGDLQ